MKVLTTRNLREMVNLVNQHNADDPKNPIQKEDIVNILKGEGQYFMVYFN